MFTSKRTVLFLTLLFLFILIIEVPIVDAGLTTQPQPGDVLIVLGAKLIGHEPSTVLKLRLDEALRLYQAGYAQKIIVSGAKGPDEEASEAFAMSQYFLNHGISPENLYLEENSFNTYQNLKNSQKIMQENNYHQAIIVSNTSHMRRALLLARQLGMEATGSPAPLPDNAYFTAKQYMREGAALVALFITPNK